MTAAAAIAVSTTDGTDWISQLGLLHAGIAVMGYVTKKDEES